MAIFLSDAIDAESESNKIHKINSSDQSTKIDIKNLASGASHEQIWLEGAEKELLNMQQQQKLSSEKQLKLEDYVNKQAISKKDLGELLQKFESEISKKYEDRLQEALSQNKRSNQSSIQESSIDITSARPKVKVKKIGEYIPAGSYAEAKMISGVDAGIGITAEADPRQVLLRITGKVISAGFGKDYLTTEKLLGVYCTVPSSRRFIK